MGILPMSLPYLKIFIKDLFSEGKAWPDLC